MRSRARSSAARPSSSTRVSLGTRQLVTFLRDKSAKNGYCWWRQEKIAEVMERGLRTVNRQIAEAVAAGLIRSERHGHGNYYTPCDLVEKVAYREAGVGNVVENSARSAAAGVSDTPNWRIATPPISITELLKPEKSVQSESTVQEHHEPAGAATEPSPFEKAQADAIADAVRACGFEPTPDLVAKLERKRRHYNATGFRVAAAIARAFKLVDGTSNAPQKPAWFTAVVENALKATGQRLAEQPRAGSEKPTTHAASWTPTPDAPARQGPPEPVSDPPVTEGPAARPQVQSTAFATSSGPMPRAAEACGRCGSDGVVNGVVPAAWCDCIRGREKRRAKPNYVEVLNRSPWRAATGVSVVQPRSPQSEQHGFQATRQAGGLGR